MPLNFQTWQGLTTRLHWAYEGSPLSGLGPVRSGPQTRLWVVLAGRATVVSVRGRSRHFPAGHACLLPPHRITQRFSPGTLLFSVGFDARWPDFRPLFTEIATGPVPAALVGATRRLGLFSATLVHPVSQPSGLPLGVAECARLQGEFHAWLAEVLDFALASGTETTPPSGPDPRLRRALAVLQSAQGPVCPLGEAAQACGLSNRQLDRLLVIHYGATARGFWDRCRAERIAERLADEPCKVLAYEYGFNTLPHFSRWFRSHHGVSPRAFLRGIRAT